MRKSVLLPLAFSLFMNVGCSSTPGGQSPQTNVREALRNDLVSICIDNGCAPQTINYKVSRKMQRFDSDINVIKENRTLTSEQLYRNKKQVAGQILREHELFCR